MKRFRAPALLFAVLLTAATLQAQQRMKYSFLRPAPQPVRFSILDASEDPTTDTSHAPLRTEKSGSLAMGLSALLPGAGQVYAERYYTIPIIWGFGGYFVSQWLKMDKKYEDYRGRFAASVAADSLQHAGNTSYKEARDWYHDARDDYALYLGLTYLLNIIDAYVGASLYAFDVSDDLGSAKMQVRVPLR